MLRSHKIILGVGLIVLIIALAFLVIAYRNRANPYWGRKAYISLAGVGDPWPYLSSKRRLLLRSLHDGYSLESVEKIVRLPKERILTELQVLEDIGLVATDQGWYRPTFFIANRDETEKTYAHARITGSFLADELLLRWSELEQDFSSLQFSRSRSLADMGFMLVGGRILDIGMLGALVEDGSLLPPAPPRPTPERPDSRYYLWMVEGDVEHLGRYGQDDTDLPRADWHFLTFAQNVIGLRSNPTRRALDKKCWELLDDNPDASPEFFARTLNVDLMSREDSEMWAVVTQQVSADLVAALKRSGPEIADFYDTLRMGQDTDETFGEFFVWYYHLAFAWAIDELAEKGVFTIPDTRCSALILYREGKEGLVKGLE
jgi:hypothetical protein